MIIKSNTGKGLLLAAAMAFSVYANPANSDEIGNFGREIKIASIPFSSIPVEVEEKNYDNNVPKSIDDKVQELIVDLTTNRGNVVALNNTFSRATEYQDYVMQAYRETGIIKRNTITALMATESNGNLRNGSKKGAKGLMQLMPETARYMGLHVGKFIDERMHPKSIINATAYFGKLMNKYGNELLALAAYNHGPTKLDEKIKKYGKDIEALWPYLPTETQNFIVRVLARRTILDEPSKYGVEITQQPLFSYKLANAEIYKVEKGDNFIGIARRHGVSLNDIKYPNPEIINYNKINIGQKIYVPKKAVIR